MAKKRITLVKDFREILGRGNLDELKAVFDKCDVNAKDTWDSNAFNCTPLPREFAFWLKEQGADINKKDCYGKPPIFNHASNYDGDVALLIELGANTTLRNSDNETLLHIASTHRRIDAMKVLLENGADVNAKHQDRYSPEKQYTPLEQALIEGGITPTELVEVSELLLENGAKITEKVKEAVTKIGEKFEFYRNDYKDTERLKEHSDALNHLYKLFDVEPAKQLQREIHDGVSPIIIKEKSVTKQYNKMWEYLVPSNGCAKTGQGEAIRIVGKVAREIMDNGGINWDKEFKKMLDILPKYFVLGTSLPENDINDVSKIVKMIYNGNGDNEPETLMDYAVKWVMQNQIVVPVITHTYSR